MIQVYGGGDRPDRRRGRMFHFRTAEAARHCCRMTRPSGPDSFTWRHANHSSNFWVGTATELIHVPVTPRKNMYNPVCALRLVNAARFETNLVGDPGGCEPEPPTVYLPCFCQGAISQQRTDLWQLVGRNRFSKAGARHPVKPSASSGVAVQCG